MTTSLSTSARRSPAARIAGTVLLATALSVGALLGTAASAEAAPVSTPTATPKACYVPGMPNGGSAVGDPTAGEGAATQTPVPDECAATTGTPTPDPDPTPSGTPTSGIDSSAFVANSCTIKAEVLNAPTATSGATLRVSGSGIQAGESVTFYITSPKAALASVNADAAGDIDPIEVTLDKSYSGSHSITASGDGCPAAAISLGHTASASSGIAALAFTGVASAVMAGVAVALFFGGWLLVLLARARRNEN